MGVYPLWSRGNSFPLFRYHGDRAWIAKEYENIDELTWKITLNDGVVFSNGRACDGEAVKESLEALVANHERAAGDLCIDTIEAERKYCSNKRHTEPKACTDQLSQ